MGVHSDPLSELGMNPGGYVGYIRFYRFFDFLKRWSGFASHHGRVRLHCLQDTAGVPLAYAESPSREHDHLQSPGVSTPVGLALLLLPSSALRCLYARALPRAWARSSMAAAALPRAALPPDWRATRAGVTVSHRGRRHRVVRLPGNHWRTRALRERADGRTGTGAPLLLGLSVGTYTEGWSSALPSLARCLPPSPLPPPSLPPR